MADESVYIHHRPVWSELLASLIPHLFDLFWLGCRWLMLMPTLRFKTAPRKPMSDITVRSSTRTVSSAALAFYTMAQYLLIATHGSLEDIELFGGLIMTCCFMKEMMAKGV